MPSVDPMNPGNDIWSTVETDYWRIVGRTLDKVFHADPGLVEQFRRKLADASPLERALVLHEDPLYVAADLAQAEELTREHIYIFRVEVLGQEPPEWK